MLKVYFSINTLDEDFRKEMDRGVSIKRRLEAMKLCAMMINTARNLEILLLL